MITIFKYKIQRYLTLSRRQSTFVTDKKFPFLALKKCIAFVILLCFSFSSSAEARSPKHPNIRHANKLQTQKAAVRGKHLAVTPRRTRPLATPQRKTQQRLVSQRRATQYLTPQRRIRQFKGPQRKQRKFIAPQVRVNQVATSQATANRAAASQARSRQFAVSQRKGRQFVAPRARAKQVAASQAAVQKPAALSVKPPVNTYLSLLKPHTQRNAKLGGLDHLYSKNISGQGQTVAVIEYSGEWQLMKDVMNNKYENVPSKINERYKRNFLKPIGGGRLHPEEKNGWVRVATRDDYFHGSCVSSVVMDLAPQTKVLPVSTYNSPETPTQPRHFYDTSDALMDLSKNKDVGIINISGGWVHHMGSEGRMERDANGQWLILSKPVYTPKLVEAFKAVARAGKVVIIGSGNEGKEIQPLKFEQEVKRGEKREWIAHLLETLDPETRKSILIAGNIDPTTCKLCSTSNKPGNWAAAQERFLCAPGHHMLSHVDYVVKGTSVAAPYICAVTALLASKGYAPKRVINALLETAEKDPDKGTYGSGRMIRAGKALEYLEKGN